MSWTYTVLDALAQAPLPGTIAFEAAEYFAQRSLFHECDRWLQTLGCPYVKEQVIIFDQKHVSSEERLEMRMYFPKLLHEFQVRHASPYRRTSILVGLGEYVLGDDYPATENEANSLACAVLFYVANYAQNEALDVFAMPYLIDLLNRWLRPAEPWLEMPGVVTICANMFGAVWCDLELSSRYQDRVGPLDGEPQYIDSFVHMKKPPFLPGLCPAQDGILEIPLPDDMGLKL